MVANRRVIDLEDNPSLERLIEIVTQNHEDVDVRLGGKSVAVLTPAEESTTREMTAEERRAAFLESAGSLKGLIPEDFIEQNRRARDIPSQRHLPEL